MYWGIGDSQVFSAELCYLWIFVHNKEWRWLNFHFVMCSKWVAWFTYGPCGTVPNFPTVHRMTYSNAQYIFKMQNCGFGRFFVFNLLNEWRTVRLCASYMMHSALLMTDYVTVCWQSSIEDTCSQLSLLKNFSQSRKNPVNLSLWIIRLSN